MSARRHVYVSKKVPFESPPSPHSTVNQITVEVRVFYPPNAPTGYLVQLLAQAMKEAGNELIDGATDLAHTTEGGNDQTVAPT